MTVPPHDKPEKTSTLPSLPLEEWEDTKETLHRYAQIVGKVRLAAAPYRNHWWHAPLYLTSRGLTTRPMFDDGRSFEILFDLVSHELAVTTSTGASLAFALEDGLSVAAFYRKLFAGLETLGIEVAIKAVPFDLDDDTPFAEDTAHASYDRPYVERYWRILVEVDRIFKEFAGRFYGKQSPVHLFWHSFDLAVTRFSDRRVPHGEDTDRVTREAYSHEVISFGFWAGDQNVREPAFYAYTAPEPEGLTDQPLRPDAAFWTPEGGTALLMYEPVRKSGAPRETLLEFLESAYLAGAKTAGWDVEGLRAEPVG